MEKQLLEARAFNWAKIIQEKCDMICEQRKNDVDLTVDILNGKIYEQAQEEFKREKQAGLYDSMNMPVEYNL